MRTLGFLSVRVAARVCHASCSVAFRASVWSVLPCNRRVATHSRRAHSGLISDGMRDKVSKFDEDAGGPVHTESAWTHGQP